MIYRNFKKTLLLLLMAAGMAGCISENIDSGQAPKPDNGNHVTFTVHIPGQQIPTTRTYSGPADAEVRTIDLLIFKSDGTLLKHVGNGDITIDPQSDVENKDYELTFTTSLNETYTDAETIAFVANAVDDVATLIGDKTSKKEILEALIVDNDARVASTPIPMYGEKNSITGGVANGKDIDGIVLTRMLARIDVVNNAANFTLLNVYIVNRNPKGYIAPKWDANGKLTSELPNISDAFDPIIGFDNALEYDAAAPVYVCEADETSGIEGNETHTKAICLLLEGEFNSGEFAGKTYYYRVDFTADTDDDNEPPYDEDGFFNPDFDIKNVSYIPVKRNHLYSFDIIKAIGPGYTNPEDALNSLGVLNNLKTKLHIVDHTGVTNMVFNGQHYIGLGNAVTFGYEEGMEIPVPCVTNYWDGWSIEKITYDPSTDNNWLTTTPIAGANPDPAIKKIILKTESENSGATNRIAYVHVKAGRLTHQLAVTQNFLPVFYATPKELYFGYSVIEQSASVTSNIGWSVASKPAWCSTVTPMSGTGNGSLSVNVTPINTLNDPSLAASDYKREAMIDFANPDGISLESQSITVTQYAPVLLNTTPEAILKTETIPYDAKEYTVSVATNLPGWTVKVTCNFVSADAPVGTRTGPNPTTISAAVANTRTVSIPENPEKSSRIFNLYLSCSGFQDQLIATITQQRTPIKNYPAYPGVIGYDPASNKLNLDGVGLMAYFKGGSVVAMYSGTSGLNGDDGYTGESVAFNPSSIDCANYNNVPSTAYLRHDYASVCSDGIGDPCRLIGLSLQEIESGIIDNNTWRMPTKSESGTIQFYAYPSSWTTQIASFDNTEHNGHTFAKLNSGNEHIEEWTFLPAAGTRYTNGRADNQDVVGAYWYAGAGKYAGTGTALHFTETNIIRLYENMWENLAAPIRCVRK